MNGIASCAKKKIDHLITFTYGLERNIFKWRVLLSQIKKFIHTNVVTTYSIS